MKGQFFSLTVLLILLLLGIFVANQADVNREISEFRIERAQITSMDHFVRDFERYYAQNIIDSVARATVVARTNAAPFSQTSKAEFIDIMDDGVSSQSYLLSVQTANNLFKQAQGTQAFALDTAIFTYTLTDVTMSASRILTLTFDTQYSFDAFDIQWQGSQTITSDIPVEGMYHPAHADVIDDSWVPDPSGCLAEEIFVDADFCSGNVMPFVAVI